MSHRTYAILKNISSFIFSTILLKQQDQMMLVECCDTDIESGLDGPFEIKTIISARNRYAGEGKLRGYGCGDGEVERINKEFFSLEAATE